MFRRVGPAAQLTSLTLQSFGLVGASQFIPKIQMPVTYGDSPAQQPAPRPLPQHETVPPPSAAAAAGSGGEGRFRAQCPMDFSPVDVPADGVCGVKRVTRHGMFWSMGMFGLGAAVGTPYATVAAMGAFPALFAAVGGLHQDSRYRRGMGGSLPKDLDEKTSSLPFVALLTGVQSWGALADELKWSNAAAAVAVALLLAARRRSSAVHAVLKQSSVRGRT